MPPQQTFTQAPIFQVKQPQAAIQSQNSTNIFGYVDFGKVDFTPSFTPTTPMSVPFNPSATVSTGFTPSSNVFIPSA